MVMWYSMREGKCAYLLTCLAISATSPACQFVLRAVLPQCRLLKLLFFGFEIGDWTSLVHSNVSGRSESVSVTNYAVSRRFVLSPYSTDTTGNARQVASIGLTGMPVLQPQCQEPPP